MVWCGTAALVVHEQWQWVCCFPQVNRFLDDFGDSCSHSSTVLGLLYLSWVSGCGRIPWQVADPGLRVSVLRSPYEHWLLSLLSLSLSISLFYMRQSHVKSFTCLFKLSPALGTSWVHLLYCSGGRKNNHKLYAILKGLVKITSYRGTNKHVLLQYPSLLQNTCVYVCILKMLMY